MCSDVAIEVEGLSKSYRIYRRPEDRLRQAVLPRLRRAIGRPPGACFTEHRALRDVSFSVRRGETVGILGRNGAGKSTLLQIVCGTLSPTAGRAVTRGRVSALLELGAGFNPEFTGRENAVLNARLLGLAEAEIAAKLAEIEAFAEIGAFFDRPVKLYSSGMHARLAFSVAVSVEPEILVVDETLAVGDLLFQARAVQRMREMMRRATVLFVSHSLGTVKSFCGRALLIEDGMLAMDGPAAEVCDSYERMMQDRLLAGAALRDRAAGGLVRGAPGVAVAEPDPGFPESGARFRFGSGALRFVRGDLLVNGAPRRTAEFGDTMELRLLLVAQRAVKAGAVVGYMVRNEHGVDVFGRNLYNERRFLPALEPGQAVAVTFAFRVPLARGAYSVSLGVKSEPFHAEFYDAIHVARTFEVADLSGNYVPGLMFVENEVEIRSVAEAAA